MIFDDTGDVSASTLGAGAPAAAFARRAAELLEGARRVEAGDAPLTQVEVSTGEGSVFVVSDGSARIAATTPPDPTVGLVFYDLKSTLRQLSAGPATSTAAPRREPRRASGKTAEAKKPAAKKAAAKKPPAEKKPAAPRKPAGAKKPAARRKKPDAP